MDLLAELTRANLDPAVLDTVRALLARAESADQLEHAIVVKDGVSKAANDKISALTLELAHHPRIRFANKSEALTAEQRDLFDECLDIGLAAMEAELQQQRDLLAGDKPKKKRPRAGRRPLPPELPRIEHRHEPASCASAVRV